MYLWEKRWVVFGRRVRFSKRKPDGMGNFGGGWQYALGIRMGREKFRGTIYIELITCELSIDRKGA